MSRGSSGAQEPVLEDHVICEVVARAGGYEEVEANQQWEQMAKSLGVKKSLGKWIKERYEDMLRYTAEAETLEETDESAFEVEALLESRVVNGKTEYLVKWKGFEDDGSEAQATWEPAANLEGARELVSKFEAARRKQPQQPQQPPEGRGANAESSAEAEALSGGKRAREGAGGAICKVLRMKKPAEGGSKQSELFYEVACVDGTVLERVSETRLTAELETCKLLYEFLRQRLSFF